MGPAEFHTGDNDDCNSTRWVLWFYQIKANISYHKILIFLVPLNCTRGTGLLKVETAVHGLYIKLTSDD